MSLDGQNVQTLASFGRGSARRRNTGDPRLEALSRGREPKPGDVVRPATVQAYKTTKEGHLRVDISAYSLRWEKLRDYLRREFRGFQFPDKKDPTGEHFLVVVPKMISTTQWTAIYNLRDRDFDLEIQQLLDEKPKINADQRPRFPDDE